MPKRILPVLVAIVGLIGASMTASPAVAQAGAPRPVPVGAGHVLVSGHRGTLKVQGQAVPEMTMPAFDAAVAAHVDAIEFDVQWTVDQRMVVIHDWTMDRTTDCAGTVTALTFTRVRACDAGSWVSARYVDTHVPTFEEVLAFAQQHDLIVNPEIKTDALTPTQARQYLAAVGAAGMLGRTIMSAHFGSTLAAFRAEDPEVTVPSAKIDYTGETHSSRQLLAWGADYYMPNWRTLTARTIRNYHANGIKLWVWPATSVADYYGALTRGGLPDAIVVDDPAGYAAWAGTTRA